MKKKLSMLVAVWLFAMLPQGGVKAQDPITLIIKEGITKVIKAVDLQIQRFQNETIWLQNAQKSLENTMSKVKLDEIRSWVAQQKEIYAAYFDELQRVKTAIAYYHRVKDILELQKAMLRDHKTAYRAIKSDAHFTQEEVQYMKGVFEALLTGCTQNLELLSLVIESFQLEMSDAARLRMIDEVAQNMQTHYNDLKSFAHQNMQLSLSRAKDVQEVTFIKALYGL